MTECILFEDGFEFSTVNPQSEPLLTVSVPLGLQMGNNPGKIEVQGSGHQIIDLSTRDTRPVGLQVPSGKTLALIGGDISLQGGNLTSEGGRIELGSVLESAKVELIPTSNGFTTGYDGVSKFGDINLSQATSVEVSGEGAGNLQFQGRKISLVEESLIIADTLGKENGGLFSVKASESLEIIGSDIPISPTGFFNAVEVDATGNAGNITIEAPQLSLLQGSSIFSETFGSGNAGNITLNVDHLAIRDGSRIVTQAFASGNAGDFTITATKSVDIVGSKIFPSRSGLFSITEPGSKGNAGNLNITTPQLSLVQASGVAVSTRGKGNVGNMTLKVDNLAIRDGSQITTGTFAGGNAGDLTVIATDSVDIAGFDDDNVPSGLFSSAEAGSTGNAGNLNINAPQLSLLQASILRTTTFGGGNAGNMTLKVNNLTVRDSSQISTGTFADGNGGDLNVIAADSVEISGFDNVNFSSGLFSAAEPGSTGDAGNLSITTSQLNLTDKSRISVNAFGSGNAGNINLKVDNLAIRDGSQIGTGTFADGNGGDLTVIATDSVDIAGFDNERNFSSGLFSAANPGSTGDLGNLNINSNQINVRDEGVISVNNLGTGNAGDLNINADTIFVANQAGLEAGVVSGNQGNINLTSKFIQLRRNSNITTNATGTANGGNITISSPVIAGFENSDIVANAVEGNGGNINITTQGIFGLQFRDQPTDDTSDITASSQFGINGTVEINNVGIEPNSGLVELPELINTDVVIANSCVARRNQQDSTFYITGKAGFPYVPGEAVPSDYSMFEVRAFKNDTSLKTSASRRKKGDSIVEATGIYPLENGEQVIARECES